MEDQRNQIVELFAAPRGELQLVVNWQGVKIYTSPKLKQNFLKSMSKTSRTAPIVSTLLKLINKNEFIPCYLTSSIIKSILKRQPPEFKGYSGTTMGKYILVYVENDTNIFGFASNDELSITTLHELIHKSSNKFPSQFFQTFKSELIEYYSNYWNRLFNVSAGQLKKDKVEEIVKFLYKTTETGQRTNAALIKYHDMLKETFKGVTTLEEKTLEEIIRSYIILIKIVWKAMDSGAPSLIEKAAYANRQIILPLYISYQETFGINVKKMKELCYQELYAPSEVISIPALVKTPNPKVYKLINKL
jgi:hypothetical protein